MQRRAVSGQAAGLHAGTDRVNPPDRAVEGLVGEFGNDGSGVGSSSSLLPLDDDLTAAKYLSQTQYSYNTYLCTLHQGS